MIERFYTSWSWTSSDRSPVVKFFSEGIDHRTPASCFNKPVLLRIFTFESVNTRLQIIAFECVPRLKIILDSGGIKLRRDFILWISIGSTDGIENNRGFYGRGGSIGLWRNDWWNDLTIVRLKSIFYGLAEIRATYNRISQNRIRMFIGSMLLNTRAAQWDPANASIH